MRVFYYSPFYYPQSQAAAVRSYWIVQTLKNAGYKVAVKSSIDDGDATSMLINPADNKQSFLKRLVFEILAGIELFIRVAVTDYNLYIFSSPPFITTLIGHRACRFLGKRYIIDVRDIYPDVYFAQGLISENSLFGKLVKRMTRKMYENSEGVLSVTPGLIGKIQGLAPKAKVELLINGYDKELFKPSTEKFEQFTVIFHGNMGKIQNLPVILEVAKKLENQNIDFIFIGEGPQADLFKGPTSSNVKYLGSKKYAEIPQIIAKAHVGFSARRDDEIGTDAFPVKVFEYIGVGIPVIMTPKTGVMPKMVESGIFEFQNNEVEAMAQKILELKKNGEKVVLKDNLSRQDVSKKILKLLPL